MKNGIPHVAIGEVLSKSEEWIDLDPAQIYQQVTVKMWGQGVVLRSKVSGAEIAAPRRLKVRAGQFILSRIDARNGALGLVPEILHGAVVSSDFPAFNLDRSRILPEYIGWMSKTHSFVDLCKAASEGTTNRVRLQEDLFLALQIPLPPLAEQRRILVRIEELAAKIEEARGLRREAVEEAETLVGAVTVELLEELDAAPKQIIENVAEVRGGIQKSPDRLPGSNPVRYLTVAHVQRNKILLSDPRYFEVSPAELDRWRLLAGDVLIIEGNGSADHIGRTAIFLGEIDDCVHQNHVIRIRPNRHQIEPDYLNLYLNIANLVES